MSSFDFTSRDYDNIKRDLLLRAQQVVPDWTDRDPSDFGMLMVDLWAYMGDVLHYYVDRAAGEAFLATATQRESVLAIANLLDYVPRGRTASTGTVTLANSSASDAVVDAYTSFVGRYDNTNYDFYTPSQVTVSASSTLGVVLRQGTVYQDESLTTSATGQVGQSYSLVNQNVDLSSLVVNVYEDGVNPTLYQHIERLPDADTGDRVYVTTVAADGSVLVQFGNSLNGFTPPAGSKIKATYVTTNGSAGNLPANSIVGFKASAPAGVAISSSSAFSGGLDEESITSMRTSIPTATAAQHRAVTRDDFVALALQVTDVAKATIAFVPGSGGSNASVTVYAQQDRSSDFLTTSNTSQAVSSTMQTNVVNYLQPLAMLGVNVYAAPTITWQPIDVAVTVHVNERFVANWVKSDVQAALDELFAFDNVFFGQRLTLGQVYRIVMNVAGVDYCTVTKFDLSGGSTVQDSITINSLQLPRKGTVALTTAGGIG